MLIKYVIQKCQQLISYIINRIKVRQKMTSITKRKELVNQLRKAHFPFGFEQNLQTSQYTRKYPEHKIQSTSNNLPQKKNNFSIGNKNDPSYYESQFKQKYPDHQVKGKQQPIGAKNAAQNNIVFGYQKNQHNYQTNYNDQYDQKLKQQARTKPIDNRKRNIDFGDTLTDFTTTYNHIYDHKNPIVNAPMDKAEVRKSSLMLGNDKEHFQTQSSGAYKNTKTQPYQAHKPINTANISLGSDNVNYVSQNKNKFFLKDNTRQVVDNSKIRDFRSAHFQFGFPQQSTPQQSQSKSQYCQKAMQPIHSQAVAKGNINLNIDNNSYFTSSYTNHYQNPGPQIPSQANKSIRNDVDVSYVTQAQSNFVTKDINRVQPCRTKGSLVLGQEHPDFITHNMITHDDKFNRLVDSKLTHEQIQNTKKINVVTGFNNNNYNLHSTQYGKRLGERGQLSKETLAKMRNTNIVMETVPSTNDFNGKSSYKSAYPYKINGQF